MMTETVFALTLTVVPPAAVVLMVLAYLIAQIGWTRTASALVGGVMIVLAWLSGLHWLTVYVETIKF